LETDAANLNAYVRKTLMEVIPCAVFVVDCDRRVVFWNRTAEEITGYLAAEMMGVSCSSLQMRLNRQVSSDLQASLCPFDQSDPWDEECEIRRKDGSFISVVRKARPVCDEGGEFVGGVQIMMDVSFIKQARSRIAVLTDQVAHLGRLGRMVGSSPAMLKLYEAIRMVAATEANVVIEGETGTGKELVAREIHESGARSSRPMVVVNCGALPETLIEAELFGHIKGAFTGATSDRAGRFEEADGGTLFLDEVGELPPAAQVKLLRAVQEGEISRVGESRVRRVDVRIIAATNRDLLAEAEAGRFRKDLYYRLRIVTLPIPPLRDRKSDIVELVSEFVDQLNRKYDRQIEHCRPEVLEAFQRYDWPGNVRQLEHAIEHAFVVSDRKQKAITLQALPPELPPKDLVRPGQLPAQTRSPDDERAVVQAALAEAGGNKSQAAVILGITRAGLYGKLKRLGITA
jgi:two-component system, NtrC family, response regulator HydG